VLAGSWQTAQKGASTASPPWNTPPVRSPLDLKPSWQPLQAAVETTSRLSLFEAVTGTSTAPGRKLNW
jgi:hypothetical protein